MASGIRYFVGNWKMFGISSSYKILDNVNKFFKRDKKNKNISISAQNCYHKDNFCAFTGNISPFMIKQIGIKYIIIGHSENRIDGDTNKIIREKIIVALKNNLKIILCIGENKKEKKLRKTLKVLKNQISQVIKKRDDFKNITIAYEPIWSIGSGILPSTIELQKNIIILKKFLKHKYRLNYNPKLLYGGSVDKNSIKNFRSISELDGFLIGGASKSSKNFIDIIKNFYK